MISPIPTRRIPHTQLALLAVLLAAVTAIPAPCAAKETAAAKDSIAKLLGRAQGLVADGRADSALALLSRELTAGAKPSGSAASPTQAIDHRLARGVVSTAQSAGTPVAGVAAFMSLLPHRAGDPEVHVALGELELGRGRPEVALRHFERAMLLNDDLPTALGGYSRARANLGTIEPGVSDYDKLSQARPSKAAPRFGKGVLLLESGQLDGAMKELKWAIGLEEQNWLYNYEYGRALERQGKKDLATRQYETALKQVKEIGDPLTAGQVEAALRASRSK
jgi:tetratricopeptide (TPR) repeat protein